jgi:hypothetical protein
MAHTSYLQVPVQLNCLVCKPSETLLPPLLLLVLLATVFAGSTSTDCECHRSWVGGRWLGRCGGWDRNRWCLLIG